MPKYLALLLASICVTAVGCGDGSISGLSLISTTPEAPGANCANGGVRFDVGLDNNGNGTLDPDEITSTGYTCNGVGAQSLVTTTPEAPGANCTHGGQRIDYGVDDNANGVLDPAEIDGTTFACNGTDGGQSSLVAITAEPAGANCATGGQRIDHGVDDNANGVLDGAEIDGTNFVCNGSNGLQNLVTSTTEPSGANCAAGGTRIDFGIDNSSDGVLDPAEVDGTFFVCNGLQTLVAIVPEAPGSNCASAGSRIQVGTDANANGVLDPAEVDSTSFVCNGVDGINGLHTLVATTAEAPGSNCATGGTRIDQGLDDSADGVLDPGEIDSTAFVCNGAAGLKSLVTTTPEPAGANCLAGGTRIAGGIDINSNDVLDAGEITSTSFACSGLKTLVASSVEGPGANCAGGGVRMDMGLDLNNDNALQAGEVTTTGFVCNGTNGTNGTNGFEALVAQAAEPAGPNCANGGVRVTSGLDVNRDTVLNAGEVANTSFICNGANGANGSPGANGLKSLVVVSTEPSGANCTAGGSRIDAGLDANSNNVLDAGEVTSTGFACNGLSSFGMFGADSSNSGGAGNLYSIDPNTGIATVIAPLTDAFSAMDFDGAGTLYGISRTTGELKIINTATGAVTTVGPTGNPVFMDMSFDKTTGTMYAHSGPINGGDSTLRTVNLATGATTVVGTPGFSCTGGLAVREDGTMFSDNRCTGGFGTVNKSNGALTITQPTPQCQAMTFVNGTLFGICSRDLCGGSGCPARTLSTYDVNTGVKTTVGSGNGLSGRMDALAAR